MKPRQCWSVLEDKAEQNVAKIQAEIVQARKLVATLEASQKRVEVLYEEYRQKGTGSQPLSLGMQDTMNQRQFMSQLMTLSYRVTHDLGVANMVLKALAPRLAEAEGERLKMKTLDEKEVLAFDQRNRKREQRSMDELGVSQFNRLSHP